MQTTAFNGKFGKGADERNSFNPTGGTERRMGVKGHLWNGIIKGINSSFEGTYPTMAKADQPSTRLVIRACVGFLFLCKHICSLPWGVGGF